MSGYKQGLQISIGLMSNSLWTQAYITTFDIDLNLSWETRLIVFSANEVPGFINAKMIC